MHSVPTDDDLVERRGFDLNLNPDNLFDQGNNYTTSRSINYPDFTESLFLFVPPFRDECRKLLACHSHGFLSFLPNWFVRTYHFFR